MTGLEKILKAIEEEAQAKADAIITEADRQAAEILTGAKLEAEQKCARIAEKSSADIKSAKAKAESAAALQEKKILLEARQQIISNIITKARNSLAGLPDSEFVEIILQMVKKYAHNKPGKLVFSASDKNRLPADFSIRLEAVLKQRSVENPGAVPDNGNADLEVADETADIDGGFILIYGDIEENCTFDALFSAAKEELQDKVNSLLFE